VIPDLRALRGAVRRVAQEELLSRFRRVASRRKADGTLVTDADLAVQERLRALLGELVPEGGFLGEEMGEKAQEAVVRSRAGFWCLDPLDGTSNFSSGIPYFAISLAWIEEGAVQLAVVYDPCRDECFSARRGVGAWLEEAPLTLPPVSERLEPCIALIDLKRLPGPLARRLAAEPPFHSQRNFGASALDWCQLAAGRGQLYLHGRQSLWDYAAGSLVLAEAGGDSVTLSGEPVFQSHLAGRSVVAAGSPALLRRWFAWIQSN